MESFTPKDLGMMLLKYGGETTGPCGPACLAIIENRDIKDVLEIWKGLFSEYQGWAAWKELRQYLEHQGWKVKQCRFTGEIDPTKEKFIICRVQWIGPHPDKPDFHGWTHWTEASAHTHFIVVSDSKVFCSENGWFSLSELNDYLDGEPRGIKGEITSYMEIYK